MKALFSVLVAALFAAAGITACSEKPSEEATKAKESMKESDYAKEAQKQKESDAAKEAEKQKESDYAKQPAKQ